MRHFDPLPSAKTVAQLLIINAHRYAQEREKEPAPYRLNANTLKFIAGRSRVRQSFLDDLADNLSGLDWAFSQIDDGEFVVIPIVRTQAWAKLNSKRVKDEALENDAELVDMLYRNEVGAHAKFPGEDCE